ncbi:hypothetical protein HZS_7929 [Henneguya salminicola]|nr:hypothetical protein HZS_7929 [Henneguya salminicola]
MNLIHTLQTILQSFLDEDIPKYQRYFKDLPDYLNNNKRSIPHITYGCFRISNSDIRCHGFQGIKLSQL